MAESHLQLNADGTTATRKTKLWPSSKPLQQDIIKSIFEQQNWHVKSISNINGSHWKIETDCVDFSWKVNLYISSIRDESRQPDEFKMQLGNTYPENEEEGWVNLVLGIYTVDDGVHPVEYILSGYAVDRYEFSSNPSIRGTRTSGLQKAKVFGMFTTDKSVLFRPEFLYYYIETQTGKQLQEGIENAENQNNDKQLPLQQITYGAPGTGKSHGIKRDTAGKSVIRTTFHPDSDYSTFVGAYKPVMEDTDVRVVPVVLNNGASFDQNNGTFKEKRISYKFVKQAFLKAYLGAWKKYVEAEDTIEPQFLVIEEINRGNCAQIFGDLFQLLDRNEENNFSTYPVDADTDLQKEIKNAFKLDMDGNEVNPYKLAKDIDIEGAVEDYTSNYNSPLSKDVQEGRVLLLPPNLYIWATMNTSDQSLFPIDSAFKRRWAWDYVKITDGKKGWIIKGKNYSCDWWTFVQEINKKIASATSSDDKKLGYFFCKAKNGNIVIDEYTFVSKVIFYLWNDVFKDNDTSIFKVTESSGEPSFDDFYKEENGKIVTDSLSVKNFLANVVSEKNVTVTQTQNSDGEQEALPEEEQTNQTLED